MNSCDKLTLAHVEHLKNLNVLKASFFEEDWTYDSLFDYIPVDARLTNLNGRECSKYELFHKLLHTLYIDGISSAEEAYNTTVVAVFSRVVTKNKDVVSEIIETPATDSSMYY